MRDQDTQLKCTVPSESFRSHHSRNDRENSRHDRERRADRPMAEVFYRDAVPADLRILQSLHHDMFPVDYEESFFERVVYHQDGLKNLTAISRDSEGNETLIGFVTARPFHLWECDPVDRAHLGLEDRLLDHETVFYILTLAVSPHYRYFALAKECCNRVPHRCKPYFKLFMLRQNYRKQGVGSELVSWVVHYARDNECRAAYLHVIDYNIAAMTLYWKQGFQEIACRESFYHITSGRQPNPKQEVYDAYLFAFVIDTTIDKGFVSYLLLAIIPFRSLLGHIRACLPWNTPPGSYFGGGDLPPADSNRQPGRVMCSGPGRNNAAAKQMPPWLVSLFSRQKLLRRQ